MDEASWSYAEGRLLALRRAFRDVEGKLDCTLMLINGSMEDRRFVCPTPELEWTVALNSAEPDRDGGEAGDGIDVPAQSLLLLVANPEAMERHAARSRGEANAGQP
jgi:glycogen operon protein